LPGEVAVRAGGWASCAADTYRSVADGAYNASVAYAPGLIVGLGNPMVGDDGAGPAVLGRLSPDIRTDLSVECIELPSGGLCLLDAMRGRRWAAVVDALAASAASAGTVRILREADVSGSARLVSYHDLSYGTAMGFGRALGWMLPDDVLIIGIEGKSLYEFGEGLSPEVDAGVTEAARVVDSFARSRLGVPSRDGSGP